MKEKVAPQHDLLSKALPIVIIVAVAALLITLFKVKGGVLGLALGTIAVVILIYWFMDIKKSLREEKTYSKEETEWFYDLIDDGKSVVFIAKIPGSVEEVKVRLVGRTLELKAGENFERKVAVPKGTQIQSKSYSNGVLNVKLQRIENRTNKKTSETVKTPN